MAAGEFEIWWGTIKVPYIKESLGYGFNYYSLDVKNGKPFNARAVDRGGAEGIAPPPHNSVLPSTLTWEIFKFFLLLLDLIEDKYLFYIYMYS